MADTSRLTHLKVEGTRRSPSIDYSSLNVLGDCQWRWHHRYVLGNEYEPSVAMKMGTLLGEACQEFYAGRPWEAVCLRWLNEWKAENPDAEFAPEFVERACWLMERYAAYYADDRKDVVQVGAEIPFRLRLPGRYGWLVGRIDEVWRINGRIWIVERKTGNDFRKLDSGLFMWDPQTSLYYWAAQQLGYEPWGIVIDFLRTYRWKRDEHPPEDSFRREYFDRNTEHLDAAIKEASKGLTLAKHLIGGTLLPLRNLGEHCSWCECRNACVTDLAFGDLAVPDELHLEI